MMQEWSLIPFTIFVSLPIIKCSQQSILCISPAIQTQPLALLAVMGPEAQILAHAHIPRCTSPSLPGNHAQKQPSALGEENDFFPAGCKMYENMPITSVSQRLAAATPELLPASSWKVKNSPEVNPERSFPDCATPIQRQPQKITVLSIPNMDSWMFAVLFLKLTVTTLVRAAKIVSNNAGSHGGKYQE